MKETTGTQVNESASTLQDVRLLPSRGPWPTKSGGELRQRFQIPLADVQKLFLTYPISANADTEYIRGMRVYTVDGIPKGKLGANEYHKLRTEIIIASRGSFRWICTDRTGAHREYTVDQSQAILVPPMIVHSYEGLSDHGSLIVLASTTFDPQNPETHDAFPADAFKQAVAPPQ